MRINEFKEKLNKLEMQYGYGIKLIIPDETFNYYRVIVNYNGTDYYACHINMRFTFDFTTMTSFLQDCHDKDFKRDLFNVAVEFAKTPLDERGDEKRYLYRLKYRYLWIADKLNNEKTYLNFRTNEYSLMDIFLGNAIETNLCKTQFTDKKVKELVEKYDIDLSLFEKIEVREDE